MASSGHDVRRQILGLLDSAGWSRAERVQVQAVESRLQHINAAVALSLDAKDRDLDIDEPYFMYSYKTILRSGAAGRSCRLFYGAQTPEAVPLDLMPEYELEIVVSHTLAFRFYDGWSARIVYEPTTYRRQRHRPASSSSSDGDNLEGKRTFSAVCAIEQHAVGSRLTCPVPPLTTLPWNVYVHLELQADVDLPFPVNIPSHYSILADKCFIGALHFASPVPDALGTSLSWGPRATPPDRSWCELVVDTFEIPRPTHRIQRFIFQVELDAAGDAGISQKGLEQWLLSTVLDGATTRSDAYPGCCQHLFTLSTPHPPPISATVHSGPSEAPWVLTIKSAQWLPFSLAVGAVLRNLGCLGEFSQEFAWDHLDEFVQSLQEWSIARVSGVHNDDSEALTRKIRDYIESHAEFEVRAPRFTLQIIPD